MSRIVINTFNSTLKLPKLNLNLKFYVRQVIALLSENSIIQTVPRYTRCKEISSIYMTDVNLPNKNVVRSDLMKISFFKFNEETCSRRQLLTNDKNPSYV